MFATTQEGVTGTIAPTRKAMPEIRRLAVNMVPLIPLAQNCRLNHQSVRFAIPVGDPRMVKTDSLPTQ
jgi:hypothetical protein